MTELYAVAHANVPTVGTAVSSVTSPVKVLPYAPTGLASGTYDLFGAHDGVVTIVSDASFTIA